ncbi:MAG: Crp/Fnr family transcriptional regulator [Acidiphilium sp.]
MIQSEPAKPERRRPETLMLATPESTGGRVGEASLIATLTQREREQVIAYGHRRVLNRGRTLFSQGAAHDGIYLIEHGRIRVFYTAPSGREITLAYWYQRHFVGGPEIFGSTPHLWTGVAASNSIVMHFPTSALKQMVRQIPAFAIAIIESLSFKGRCYSALAQMLGTHSVTERLAHLLLHLAQLHGTDEAEGVVIASGLTHAELAHLVGATRQWVTISLRRLQRQGILTCGRGRIVLHRPHALALRLDRDE